MAKTNIIGLSRKYIIYSVSYKINILTNSNAWQGKPRRIEKDSIINTASARTKIRILMLDC